jgi:1-acyl-sn-glycerol-3-phosphate acyltransferase
MQNIVIDKPYQFVPPLRHRWWPAVLQPFLPWYLNRVWGVTSVECRNVEPLRASVAAGDGIVLAPNHCRLCDPMVLGSLTPHIGTPLHAIGSWHLFMQDRTSAWMARMCGAFSIYREGMDRQSVNTAIDIIEHARRPLIIFPEGVVSRTNDIFHELLEGASFIARSAAKKRAKHDQPGRVVVFPIALKYYFRGDLQATLEPVLADIEHRLSWQSQNHLPLFDRIVKMGGALLCLKEIEYLGRPQEGTLFERLARLIDHLLMPLEDEWLQGKREPHVVARVKKLRSAILADMVGGAISPEERDRRWRQLADIYLAQQLSWYPPDYLRSRPTPERLLETVERFEEDLTDAARVHRPLECVIEVGEAIEVSPERDRAAKTDPLLSAIHEQVQGMLDRLADATVPLPWAVRQSAAMETASV